MNCYYNVNVFFEKYKSNIPIMCKQIVVMEGLYL